MPVDTPRDRPDTIIAIERPGKLSALSIDPGESAAPPASAISHFKIRLANTEGRRSRTSYLIRRQYAWRGYQVGELSDLPANRITLAAFGSDDQPIATITVGIDSPAGLAVESIYREEIDALRAQKKQLAEFTKLAVDGIVRSKAVLAAMFHIAYIYAHRIRLCTDLVIEVNPRHVRFYQMMLGFERRGAERLDHRVNAPAVLLRLDFSHAEAEIGKLGGHPELGDQIRSLYPLFFSPAEERGIEGRLRLLN